jgi:peptidyl-prolyl cis-trans isomerase D
MLGTIRDKATGWIAGIIVGALIISFAFWGVSSYFGGGDVYVATVNGSEIKYTSFQRAFYNLRQQMQSVLGGDALTLEEEEFIKEQTLQKLVDTELVNQMIQDNGFRVTNDKVVDTIKNLEFFKGENGFDRLKYERAVRSMGMDPVFFEAQLRMDLLSEQLQAGLSDSLFVLDSELENILKLKSQTRDLTYTTLSLTSFIDETSEVSDSEIEAFYKANPEKFADPEKVKIAYLELDVNQLAEDIETDEESLRDYYSSNKGTYDVDEQRTITKLFVQTAVEDADKNLKEGTEEEKAKAKEVIESALAMVKEGKGFEEVLESFTKEGKGALQFSENVFLPRGVLEKEVEEFLFNSDEGAVSDVIETKKGFNIVKVGEIRGGPKNVYENVAEKVAHDYKKSQAELQFFELADQLTNLAYEHSSTLEVAADAIEKDIVETDFFSRNSATEGIISKPQVISRSFDPELINSGQNSDAIELSDNHIVVIRVLEHQDAKTKPLENVREEVIAGIRQERAVEEISKTSAAIVEQLESGVSTDEVKTDVALEWTTVENTKRDNAEVNRSVLRNAFKAGIPSDKPVVTSNRLGSGDYSIIIVTAVHDAEIVEDDESENISKATDIELRRSRGTNEWRQFMKNVKSNADIQLFKENI